MNILNPCSNLTPEPLVQQGGGNTPKHGILIAKKCLGIKNDWRNDNNRGLSEHRYLMDVPYFSAAHNF